MHSYCLWKTLLLYQLKLRKFVIDLWPISQLWLGTPENQFLHFCSRLSVNNYFWHLMYKLFDQKRLQIIYKLIWHHKIFVEKLYHRFWADITYTVFFLQKNGCLSECKPQCNKEKLSFPLSICTRFLQFSSLNYWVWWTGYFSSLNWVFLPAVACRLGT